ncbi:MAG: UvrD-helicase domain-containing protein [Elusimicrobia bacterium]|nr:UvrD-helicase domain-containing protein [Elusimicrobiota bacterium]
MILDQSARDLARKNLTVNLVVEAGAGTGKTTLLTDRLMFLLLAGGPEGEGLPITRVVALTFTDKAAGEIKVRLAERLGDLLLRLGGGVLSPSRRDRTDHWVREARADFNATDDRLRAMATEALRELDRAPLGTLHSFCRTLLKLYPMEAGLTPGFRVDNGEAFESLFREEWARWLEEELVPGRPSEGLWRDVLPHVGLGDLALLARSLAQRTTPPSRPETFGARLAALRRSIETLPEGKPVPRLGKMLASLVRVAERLRSVETALENIDGPLTEEDPWEEKAKEWPAAWAGLDGEALYREALTVAKTVSPGGERAVARARRLLDPFVERFRARFRSAGWLGFDDLLRGARDLLAQHPEVRRELKARYGAVLVDEFQDTDPLQGETLLYLAEAADSEATSWREVSLAPGKLFIVGDPKQSIYRFRGADIRAYEAFVDLVLAQGGLRCDLQMSFRTHEGIVGPVNRLFTDLMVESPGLQPLYRPLLPRPGAPSGEAGERGVELVLFDDPALSSARSAQAAEARWIAGWIVEHVGPASSPWRLGDVALLFRSTAALTVYMEALKSSGIPYLVESDRSFYSTPEVMDFLNLLRILVDPADRVARVGLLRSPLVALEDRDLLALSEADAWTGETRPPDLSDNAWDALREFQRWTGALRAAAARDSLGVLAQRVLRESPILAAAAAAYHGEQSVSNLFKLARLAGEAHQGRGETLTGFVRWLVRAVGEGVEEGESPLGEESVDAVRLLTVHKAKGLEYKIVFLPNLSAKVQGGARNPPAVRLDWAADRAGHRLIERKWADAAMAFLEADERRREADEAVRVFYVAATRARERVILLGQRKDAPGSFMAMLRRGVTESDGVWSFADGLRLPVVRAAGPAGGDPLWPRTAAPRDRLASPGRNRAWERRRKEHAEFPRGDLFLRPSDLKAAPPSIDRSTPQYPPEEADHGSDALLPDEQGRRTNAAVLGELCHSVLAEWDFTGAGLETALSAAVQRLRGDRPRFDWAVLAGEARRLLEGFADSPAARVLREAEVLLREAPVLFPRDGKILRGSLDLLYRAEGRTIVADFKTDRVTPGEEAARAREYEAQGEAYVEGIRRSLGLDCDFEVIFIRTGCSVKVLKSKTIDKK